VKAAVLREPGTVVLEDVPVPRMADDEVLVRTGAATICTSDLVDIRTNPFGIRLPVIIGHEAAGTVAGVGPLVKDLSVGDRVATHPVHPCGACAACRAGMRHLCMDMGHLGITRPGVFAEYFTVRADRARRVPVSLDLPLAALAEPVAVCLEALAQARLAAGGSLLIAGDGPFGLLLSRLAPRAGAGSVTVLGRHAFRLGFARGCRRIDAAREPDPAAALRDAAGPGGFDAAILAVASKRAFDDCAACLARKGRLVLFAALSGPTPVDLVAVHLRELEIVGSCNDAERFDEALGVLCDSGAGIADLVTHRIPFVELHRALALAETAREQALKVAIVFPQEVQ
jgi:threonine dehydrogenase-like Zn-dependent dehydrogenase